MKSIEVKGKTLEIALELALQEFGATANQVSYEILEEKKGLFKSVTLLVTKNETLQEKLQNFMQNLLSKMKLSCQAEVSEANDCFFVNIIGDDNGVAIGYRGEVLDNIQYLTLLFFNNISDCKKRVIVDAENYRQKREETLTKLSIRMAHKVAQSGLAHEFEPMNPYERRIIHTALQEDTLVTTRSEGDEPRRFIIIEPKSAKPNDIYNNEDRNSFKRTGMGKTRSFGAKRKTF